MADSKKSSWIWLGLLGVLIVFGFVGWAMFRAFSVEKVRVDSQAHALGLAQRLFLNEILHAQEVDRPPDPADQGKSDRDFSRLAATYYHRDGPLGRVLEKYNWFPGPRNTFWADARLPASVTVLLAHPHSPAPIEALGQLWSEPPMAVLFVQAHAAASYARPLQWIDVYEPNRAVADLFRPGHPGRSFQQLHDARQRGANVNIIDGNELEMLKSGPQKFYRVIVVETSRGKSYFNRYTKSHVSAAAMMIFDQALTDDGLVCFHTSSRYDDISGDVAGVAKNFGWAAVAAQDSGDRSNDLHFSSTWVVVSRRAEALRFLTAPPPAAAKNPIRWQMK